MRFPRLVFLLIGLLSLVVSSCAPATLVTPPIPAIPTTNTAYQTYTCADLDGAWTTNDWPKVLTVLQDLQATNQKCGPESLESKAYAAHFNYAAALEATGQPAKAIEQYRAALAVNARGPEALAALVRLKALPTLPAPTCQPGNVATYKATPDDFVTVNGRGFTLKGQPFHLRGFNYYPRHAPWDAFLTSADLTEVAQEFDLIAATGFNTLRIALWYDPLFTCTPEQAVPNAAGLAKLDQIIELARKQNLKLIVTLNDLPDFYYRPLYTDYARYDAQTAFIVNRYRDESTILAWDLRNEPDLDYGADGRSAVASSDAVAQWLTHIASIVRQNDRQHLITIGWWGDATTSSELVDFLSFHHWTDAATFAQRIETLQAASNKPIVLEEVGYPALDQASETQQARSLQEVLDMANHDGIAGWLIWTAFDFVPPPGPAGNPEYYFGLWRTDLTAKPALSAHALYAKP